MTLKIAITDNGTTAKFAANMTNNGKFTRQAMDEAGKDVAEETQYKCRADVAAAGRFGSKWTSRVESKSSPFKDGVQVVTTFDSGLWQMFQTGMVVRGAPLLWLPLSHTDAKGVRVDDYPGALVHVDRKDASKAPLLISVRDHEPKYVGKAQVTIPKKFHLIEIATEVGKTLPARYSAHFKRLHG